MQFADVACALKNANCYNFGIAERLRTLRYPIFTGGGRDGKRQLRRLVPAEMRRCGGELPKPRFTRKVAANGVSRLGEHTLLFAQKVCENG